MYLHSVLYLIHDSAASFVHCCCIWSLQNLEYNLKPPILNTGRPTMSTGVLFQKNADKEHDWCSNLRFSSLSPSSEHNRNSALVGSGGSSEVHKGCMHHPIASMCLRMRVRIKTSLFFSAKPSRASLAFRMPYTHINITSSFAECSNSSNACSEAHRDHRWMHTASMRLRISSRGEGVRGLVSPPRWVQRDPQKLESMGSKSVVNVGQLYYQMLVGYCTDAPSPMQYQMFPKLQVLSTQYRMVRVAFCWLDGCKHSIKLKIWRSTRIVNWELCHLCPDNHLTIVPKQIFKKP